MAKYRKIMEDDFEFVVPWMDCRLGYKTAPGGLTYSSNVWSAVATDRMYATKGAPVVQTLCPRILPMLSATTTRLLDAKSCIGHQSSGERGALFVIPGMFERLYDAHLLRLVGRYQPWNAVQFYIATGNDGLTERLAVGGVGHAMLEEIGQHGFLLKSPAKALNALVVMRCTIGDSCADAIWKDTLVYLRERSSYPVVDLQKVGLLFGIRLHVAMLLMDDFVRELCADMMRRLELVNDLWIDELRMQATYGADKGPTSWQDYLKGMGSASALMMLLAQREEVKTICWKGVRELGWHIVERDEFSVTVETNLIARRFFFDAAGLADMAAAYRIGKMAVEMFEATGECRSAAWTGKSLFRANLQVE